MEITSVLVLRECAPESGDGSKALGARLGPAGRPYYNCMPPLPMLNIQFSNRLEVLRDALLARVAEFPASPLSAPQIIVPSGAMRRHLTLAMADRDGICANVDFLYLAEWLWRQIGHVVESVETDSPYATPVLTWRIFPLLHDGGFRASHVEQGGAPQTVVRGDMRRPQAGHAGKAKEGNHDRPVAIDGGGQGVGRLLGDGCRSQKWYPGGKAGRVKGHGRGAGRSRFLHRVRTRREPPPVRPIAGAAAGAEYQGRAGNRQSFP